MQLRPYQEKIKQQIYAAWADGAQNVLVQLHTGGGKTVLFSNILAESEKPAIAIAHRMELVSQISLTLARFGIRHNIIAQKNTLKTIVSLHMLELKKSFFDPQSRCYVAGIDTLLRLKGQDAAWFPKIGLVVQDEGHHPLRDNKWGKAASLFPTARGLYPTATPVRADGCGLGRHADGIMDALIVGPEMRDLINEGFLTDYRIITPPSDLDLKDVPITASGDYSPPKLLTAVKRSCIRGDVVAHYLKFADGKLGVTFTVSIEIATEIAQNFRDIGIPAEVISSKTPDLLRANIMQRFRNKEILQLVNVDLLGEGVDVPAIEVVSFARPTQSYALYSQQFGRALRPLPGKERAIIIDHVGNVVGRHGLPDRYRAWSLDRRDRKVRSPAIGVIPLKTCLNEECMSVYERVHKRCPHCGFFSPPLMRAAPEFVDGDLLELAPDVLAKLRGEIKHIDSTPRVPQHVASYVQKAIINRHLERQQMQSVLRQTIAIWAGYHKQKGCDDSDIYRLFYFSFTIDIATAQTLNTKEATDLNLRIITQLNEHGIRL